MKDTYVAITRNDLESNTNSNKILAWSYGRTARWFSGINAFFFALYSLYSPYNLVGCGVSLLGYYGARKL